MNGGMESIINALKLPLEEFPDASFAVNTRFFSPKSAHKNLSLLILTDSNLQLSLLPLSTSKTYKTPLPLKSKYTVGFRVITFGNKVSRTVTFTLPLAVFPEASVIIKTVETSPKSAHVYTD